MTAAILVRHAVETLQAPREKARWVMSYRRLPRSVRWQALVLNTVISILLQWLSFYLSGDSAAAPPGTVPALISDLVLYNPIWVGVIQLGFAVGTVYALYVGGRAFGGHGDLDSAILLMAWMVFVLNLMNMLQIMVFMVFPFLAGLIGLAAFALIFILLTCFCAELHGFQSLFMTFIGIVFTIFALMFSFSLLLAAVSIAMPGISV